MENAALDAPLPIGFGQTNSQPTTVAMMLDWLDVDPGQKVLDIGSGSGWTTALLAHLVGPKGKVIAVELVPELLEFGRDNAERAGVKNAEFHEADDGYGWPKSAPYERILVSAAARTLPPELIKQLAPGGRMVIPIHNSVWVVKKEDDETIDLVEHPGFAFVPLQ
jgi:protein-L-isoaspartate(D-aspartate) O-methyltransferase